MTIYEWGDRLGIDPKKSKGREDFWTICPCHADTKPSLHVYAGEKTGEIVMKCFVCGATGKEVCRALDLPLGEVMCDARTGDKPLGAAAPARKREPKKKRPFQVGGKLGPCTITAIYEFEDRTGRVVLRKARAESYDESGARTGKTFAMQSLGTDGAWYGTEGIYGNLLYHLPEVLEAAKDKRPILIAEGEKDVDNLRLLGFTATCGLHGGGVLKKKGDSLVGKWNDEHAQAFDGAGEVVVIADNDAAGEGIAQWICKSLKDRAGTLKLLRIAEHYPQLEPHGDFTDWANALIKGGAKRSEIRAQLEEMIAQTPTWTAKNIRTFGAETDAPDDAQEDAPPQSDGEGDGDKYPSYYGSPLYCVKDGCLAVRQGDRVKRLCDFLPAPKEIITRDDGSARRTDFVISATTPGGAALPDARVEGVEKFAAMRWPLENWGYFGNLKVIKNASQYVLDAINTAGQKHSRQRTVYGHTGMRRIDGKMCYLYNGGAIGTASASVELPDSLKKYNLDDCGVSAFDAAASELILLDGFPARIVYPQLAQAYLAPLYSVMEGMQQPPSYVVMVVGESNAGKSTVAGYVLSHFGNFYNREFPASFEDSFNSARDKLFYVKDCLLVVDDYRKGGGDGRARNPHDQVANAVISAVADRSGRDRLSEKKELSGSRPCRGMCIMTGEDLPRLTMSRRLRIYRIDVAAGDIYKTDASELDIYRSLARSGTFRQCMRAYIEGLLARWDGIEEELERRIDEAGVLMRRLITRREGRLTECATHLMVGVGLMLDHLLACGVLSEEDRKHRYETAAAAIGANINAQGRAVDEEKPEEIWLQTLRSLLATRSVTLLGMDELGDGFKAGVIGYKRDGEYLIIPEAADEFISERLRKGGTTLDATRQAILRALVRAGKVIPQRRKGSELGNPTTSVHLTGKRTARVIRIPAWVIDDPDNPPDPEKLGFKPADGVQLPMEFRQPNNQ